MDLLFCLLFLWCLCSTFQDDLTEISLIGKNATQSNTRGTNKASLAIDGDKNTVSVAESPNSSDLGWWQVDLGGSYHINQIIITPSKDKDEALFTQFFDIRLINEKEDDWRCGHYDWNPPKQSKTIYIPCTLPDKFPTRYVKIIRKRGSKRSVAISFAEVNVKTETPPNLAKTFKTEKLPLIGKTASQSKQWENSEANLAIDGDVNTFSVAASYGHPYVLGYWEVDLGGNYQIGQVIITASSDYDNAKYLETFSIWLEDERNNRLLCYNYNSTEHLAPLETRTFPCENYQLLTRRIRITRDKGENRQNTIALAEVNVMTGLPPSTIKTGGTYIPLSGKTAEQSRTWNDRHGALAFDGDEKTFSVAASDGDQNVFGWWQVDLGENYDVGEVIITASDEKYDANYLQNFSVLLLNEVKNQQVCNEYISESSFLPLETKSFRCQSRPFQTRYVKIARFGGTHRPDAISLAEVKMKTRKYFFSRTPSSEFRTEIPLAERNTTQSETWTNRVGSLAIDGDVKTFSVAESPTNITALGWWEVDLEGNYQVGEVIITASANIQYAEYLCNFAIWLFDEKRTKHLCKNYTSSVSFYPKETISFLCQNDPFMTRYVRIAKLDGSYRKDAIALAEVKVMSGFHERN